MLTYYLPDRGEEPEDAQALKPLFPNQQIPTDPQYFAQKAADYCHSCRDGWEWEWPKTFVVLDDGREVGRFSVGMEMVPSFTATPLKA